MDNVNKVLWGVLAIILIGLAVTRLPQFIGTREPEVVNSLKVGAILPLTGDLAYAGIAMQQGIQLALDEYADRNIEVIFEDNGTFDSGQAVSAATKLLQIDLVDVMFHVSINNARAIAPLVNDVQVPTLILWDSGNAINEMGRYVFGFGFGTEIAGEKMAQFASNELNARQVTIISAFDAWSEVISHSFVTELERNGGIITNHAQVAVEEADFRTIIAQAKNDGSEAIYFPLFPQAVVNVTKQAQELGYEGYLLTGDALVATDIGGPNSPFENVYSTQPWIVNEEFAQKYRAHFNSESDPIGLALAGLGYDAVKLLVDVIATLEQSGTPVTSDTIHTALYEVESNGVTGITSFKTGNISGKIETITQVREGMLVPAK